jgi:hypothetical protein
VFRGFPAKGAKERAKFATGVGAHLERGMPNTEFQRWRVFIFDGTTHDLSHLDSKTVIYEVAAKGNKPAISYTVDVTFGTHCFTHGIPKDGVYERALEYRDGREIRIFDFRRYALSKKLPVIVDTLLGRKCLHAERSNFVTIEIADEDGRKIDYDVFFTVSRATTKGRINLFIQSAYEGATIPKSRPIRFEIILYNVQNNRPIHS